MARLRFLFNCTICHEEEKKHSQGHLNKILALTQRRIDSEPSSQTDDIETLCQNLQQDFMLFIFEDSISLEILAFGTLHFVL